MKTQARGRYRLHPLFGSPDLQAFYYSGFRSGADTLETGTWLNLAQNRSQNRAFEGDFFNHLSRLLGSPDPRLFDALLCSPEEVGRESHAHRQGVVEATATSLVLILSPSLFGWLIPGTELSGAGQALGRLTGMGSSTIRWPGS